MAADGKRVVVLGAGGHGHVVVDVLRAGAQAGAALEVVAVLDDAPALHGAVIGGLAVAGGQALLTSIPHDSVIVAIGDNRTRRRLQEALAESGEVFIEALHPAAVVSRDAVVERGAVVCAGAVVGPRARIAAGAIVNTGAVVDHHCEIGRFAHIAAGVTLAGSVSVGAESLIGIGAAVLPSVRIGARATIGAGAVILADVPDGVTMVGVPGRRVPGRPGHD